MAIVIVSSGLAHFLHACIMVKIMLMVMVVRDENTKIHRRSGRIDREQYYIYAANSLPVHCTY